MATTQQPAPTRRRVRDSSWWLFATGKGLLGALYVILALFPLAWMLIAGFKTKTEVLKTPFQFFPEVWKWENYVQILADPTFLRTMGWTFLGAVLFTLL
ncbi:MAG TPA: carbohydrate ABC transporter permease, partial [Agromyces sp.]